MDMINKRMEQVAYASLVVVCLSVFTSISIGALHHILLIAPALYFLAKDHRRWSMSMLMVAGIIVSIFLSVIFNMESIPRIGKSLSSAKYFLIPLLGVFAYRKVDWSPKRIKILLYTLLIATSVASLCGIIGLYTGYTPIKFKNACHTDRACGLFGMYMTYGYGIGLFMVLMTGALLYREQLKRYIPSWLIYSSWIINFAGLYLSYARGAWIGFLLAVPFFFIKRNLKTFLTIALLGILSVGVSFVASDTVRSMFTDRQYSNEQRLAFFETAWVAFKERPAFGWGYKNFEPNVKMLKQKYEIAYPDFQGHAHNNFLEHLAATGVIGFIVFILFHFFWFKEAWQGNRLIDKLAMPFIVALTVSGMTQVTLGDGENLFLIMTFWSLCQVPQGEMA